MADQSDVSTFGNFSIQDTMEMGLGNRELVEDFLSPETATASTEELQPITEKKVEKTVPKKVEPKKEEPKKEEKQKEEKPDLINDFLEDGEEETPDATPLEKPEKEGEDEPENRFAALSKDLFQLGVFSKDEE